MLKTREGRRKDFTDTAELILALKPYMPGFDYTVLESLPINFNSLAFFVDSVSEEWIANNRKPLFVCKNGNLQQFLYSSRRI